MHRRARDIDSGDERAAVAVQGAFPVHARRALLVCFRHRSIVQGKFPRAEFRVDELKLGVGGATSLTFKTNDRVYNLGYDNW